MSVFAGQGAVSYVFSPGGCERSDHAVLRWLPRYVLLFWMDTAAGV